MHQVDHNDVAYALNRYDGIVGWVPDVRLSDGQINPHLTRFITKDNYFVDVFHVKPVYYETLYGHWRPLSEVASIAENHKIVLERWQDVHPRYIQWLHKRQQLIGGELLIPTFVPSRFMESVQYARLGHFGLTTTTVYPDPDTESTTVDGNASRVSVNEDWATIRAGAGNNSNDSLTFLDEIGIRVSTSSAVNWRNFYRGFTLFYTGAIGSDTVDSGTYSLYVTSKTTQLTPASGVFAFSVNETNPASNTAIVNSDFQNVLDTKLGTDITDSAITTSSYNDWTLNASGLAVVNGSGVTKLGCRFSRDVENNEPAGSYSTGQKTTIIASSSEVTGTSQDPKLAIVHSAAAATFIPRVVMF